MDANEMRTFVEELSEWDVISTHAGHFNGVPPTNRRVTHQGTTELIIRNGKFLAETSYQDMAAL